MLNSNLRWVLAIVLLISIHSIGGAANASETKPSAPQPSEEEKSESKESLSESVRIDQIAQLREIELPSKFNLPFRVTNLSAGVITLKNVRLVPLEEPGGLVVLGDCNQQEYSIARSGSVILTCSINSAKYNDSAFSFLLSLFSSWSLMTLQPGEFRFLASGEATLEDEIVVRVASIASVKLRPTVWQVVFGAVVGAFMLGLFTITSSRLREVVRADGTAGWRGTLTQFLTIWTGASVAASIFIVLTFRLKDANAPITLTVNDFYGGIAVGILGYFLADWLSSKVLVSNRKPSS